MTAKQKREHKLANTLRAMRRHISIKDGRIAVAENTSIAGFDPRLRRQTAACEDTRLADLASHPEDSVPSV